MTEETCRDVRALLSELLEDELAPDARARALDHLDGCDACRAELEALKRTLEALRALPREEPPAALLERIERRLGPPGAPARGRGRFRFRRHAVAMLLAVGIVVGIIRVLPHGVAPLHAPKPAPPVGRLEADRAAPREEGAEDLKDSRRDAGSSESPPPQAPEKKAEKFARQNAPTIAANEAAPAPPPDPSALFTSPRPEPAWADSVRDALLRHPAQAAAAWRRLTDAQRAAVLDAWTRAPRPPGLRAELDSALSREGNRETASMLRAFRSRTP
jgi:hypothetical protein